ncbi:hypothetical protein CEXT_691601 [Caerostris extrusa]|uniref:Uncharacterized protein n=1 Tax=Caerostris extrusa TaxID=172846 RepID=A0AAV4SGM4_CAEEX|nr:hypothetical protein CEXT_691601 [Caerostris extrusa]
MPLPHKNTNKSSSSHQTNSQTSASLSNNQNMLFNLNGQVVYKNQPETYTGHNGASIESTHKSLTALSHNYGNPYHTTNSHYSCLYQSDEIFNLNSSVTTKNINMNIQLKTNVEKKVLRPRTCFIYKWWTN